MPRTLNNISKNEQDPIKDNGDINVGSAEKGYRGERECRRVRAGDDFPSPINFVDMPLKITYNIVTDFQTLLRFVAFFFSSTRGEVMVGERERV